MGTNPNDSGITKKFFDQYFEGRKKGYALKISSPKLYENPINPFDLFSSFVAPQSFKYLTAEDFEPTLSI